MQILNAKVLHSARVGGIPHGISVSSYLLLKSVYLVYVLLAILTVYQGTRRQLTYGLSQVLYCLLKLQQLLLHLYTPEPVVSILHVQYVYVVKYYALIATFDMLAYSIPLKLLTLAGATKGSLL